MSSKSEAQDAIFTGVAKIAAKIVDGDEYYGHQKAEALRDLALAYRYAAGGAQPGGITTVDKE